MALATAATLAAARLMELTPPAAAPLLIVALYVIPPPTLLVWSFWAMLREPVTGWLAPTLLMGFIGAFVPVARPLYDAGVRLNFDDRRPAYEAIAAEARAGTLGGLPNARGWIAGSREGVRFRYRRTDPGMIDFNWTQAYGFKVGVRYDDSPCVARPGARCIDQGEPLAKGFTYYARFF
ncbi:MAG: hypothetical protein KKE02_00345 [Alphaproteobacteria bacterium]|nr:hypothetical protein [Alphaproteobacteria bacterium]MBU2093816.1 hypothetical protein [Alphaproteobacteria bacterium]MBU2149437.1 hypothetical protein [Alphaproteobacteria bacterium]MBU2362069.1 hypothetical protein [Alphaproteobacteria bacterium]